MRGTVGPARRYRVLCRVVLDLPPALISVGLLLLLLRLLGPWQLPLLAAWLCVGPVLCCPAAERWAVGVLYGLRRPTPAEAALLEPVLMAAAARCGESVTGLDFYPGQTPRCRKNSASTEPGAVHPHPHQYLTNSLPARP